MSTATVIVSTNDSELYIQFWPIVAETWSVFGFNPVLIYVSNQMKYLSKLQKYGRVVPWKCINGLGSDRIAPIARAIYAQELPPETKVMLSDIDMLPLQDKYFDELCDKAGDNKLVLAGADIPGYGRNAKKMYPICYMVGKAKFFRAFMNPNDLVKTELVKSWYGLNVYGDGSESINTSGRFLDESLLRVLFNRWTDFDKYVVELPRWIGHVDRRIDRADWNYSKKLLSDKVYIDSHMLRPLSQNVAKIKQLVEGLGLSTIPVDDGVKITST